ncbi:MAG: RNA polymerase sigma factor [Gemmataceae bacterium]
MLPSDRIIHERGLLHAVLAGDEDAWRLWYERSFRDLQYYVSWRTGSLTELVDEVMQETWLIAIKRLRSFEPEQGSFQGWLRGIAANVIRNQLRRREHVRRRSSPVLEEVPAPASNDPERDERAWRVAHALASLSERHEQVLRAKYLEQQSVAEIAANLQQSSKAIESLLTRARQAFRDAYESEAPQEEHDASTP